MANTFKNATKSGLSTADITSSASTNILTAGGSSTVVILGILISNKTGTSADVNLYVTTSGDNVYVLKSAPVPAGSSLEVVSGSKLILESSDVLRASADTASTLDITVSYLDQT